MDDCVDPIQVRWYLQQQSRDPSLGELKWMLCRVYPDPTVPDDKLVFRKDGADPGSWSFDISELSLSTMRYHAQIVQSDLDDLSYVIAYGSPERCAQYDHDRSIASVIVMIHIGLLSSEFESAFLPGIWQEANNRRNDMIKLGIIDKFVEENQEFC